MRDGKHSEVEETLNTCFSQVSPQGQCMSDPFLKAKASEIVTNLGREDLVATDGWLSRWKVRYQIKYKRFYGEKASADIDAVKTFHEDVFASLLQEYSASDIYNADETGLFFRAAPNGSLCHNHVLLCASKKALQRIVVLC